jgi:hypothetical protein
MFLAAALGLASPHVVRTVTWLESAVPDARGNPCCVSAPSRADPELSHVTASLSSPARWRKRPRDFPARRRPSKQQSQRAYRPRRRGIRLAASGIAVLAAVPSGSSRAQDSDSRAAVCFARCSAAISRSQGKSRCSADASPIRRHPDRLPSRLRCSHRLFLIIRHRSDRASTVAMSTILGAATHSCCLAPGKRDPHSEQTPTSPQSPTQWYLESRPREGALLTTSAKQLSV